MSEPLHGNKKMIQLKLDSIPSAVLATEGPSSILYPIIQSDGDSSMNTQIRGFVCALAIVAVPGFVMAQDCQGLQLEASLALPASPGVQGRVSIDQQRIWVSHGHVALRFARSAEGWHVDGWIDGGSSGGYQSGLSADSGRVVFKKRIYSAGDVVTPLGSFGEGAFNCETIDGGWMGTNFVLYPWTCSNMFAEGVTQSSPGLPLTPPPGPPFSQSPSYIIRTKGNRACIATQQWVGSMPFRVSAYIIGGTDSAPVVSGGGLLPDGPSMFASYDLAITPTGVAATLALQTNGSLSYGVAVWDGIAWAVLPVKDFYYQYSNVTAVGSRLFYSDRFTIHEVLREDTQTLLRAPRWSSTLSIYDLAGEAGLLAALVEDPSVSAGSRLLVFRLIDQIDCDGDGVSDCASLAGGAPDINRNKVPDDCECLGDINFNGVTDGIDLATILGAWGTVSQGEAASDINRDGAVDGVDLAIVLGSWGPCQR